MKDEKDVGEGEDDGDQLEGLCGDYLGVSGSPARAVELLHSCSRKDAVSEIGIELEAGVLVSFEVLQLYVNLVTISISTCPPALIEEIVRNVPSVRNIAVVECPDMLDCRPMHAAGRIKNLQIKLCGGIQTLEGIEALGELRRFSSLYGNQNLLDVSQIIKVPQLSVFTLVDSERRVEVDFLKDMQCLREVALGRCMWLDDVSFMYGMKNLTKIYLQGSWNIPLHQLALLRLLHPQCSIVFPWEQSKLRVLFSIFLQLTMLWFKIFPRRAI